MTKTRKDNYETNRTDATYIKNKTELLCPIEPSPVYDENQIEQWRDQLYKSGLRGQILLFSQIVRKRNPLDHLVDMERSALSIINIIGLLTTHIIGHLQSRPIFFIHSTNIRQLILSHISLLGPICMHIRRILKPLLLSHPDHMIRGLWGSFLHWAWPWLKISRSSEMLVWSFSWRHMPYQIQFLLIFIYMSNVYIIRLRDMILNIV